MDTKLCDAHAGECYTHKRQYAQCLVVERDELRSKLEKAQAEVDRLEKANFIAGGDLAGALLQNDVLKRIADAASVVVRGCKRKVVPNAGGFCTCDECTHLSVCLGAYFRPEPEVERKWFARYPEKRKPEPANWDKIIGAIPDLPDHPELLKRHPLTCGECRAEIRTDMCPECAEKEMDRP